MPLATATTKMSAKMKMIVIILNGDDDDLRKIAISSTETSVKERSPVAGRNN